MIAGIKNAFVTINYVSSQLIVHVSVTINRDTNFGRTKICRIR